MNKKTIFSICAAGLILVSGMALSGCQNSDGPGLLTPETPLSRSDFLLNTFVTITLYDSDDSSILDDSMALCKEYENIFSKTLETSELYQINHRTTDTVTVSDDMAALLSKGLEYCEKSGGAFDITIEPLSSLWNFTSGEAVIPDAADIEADIPKVDYHNLVLSGNTLTFLSPDTTIDLGSIAKGYIADRIKEQLLDAGVKSAIINLGGNVLCMGEKPDGENMPQDTTTDESGTSTKGIKAGGGMYLNGGTYQIDSADDSIHSNANITIACLIPSNSRQAK